MAQTSDKGCSLSEIACQQENSIVSLLVDIQDSTETTPKRALRFIEQLDCLELPAQAREDGSVSEVKVRRRTIDGTEDGNYVALSYTWRASNHEIEESGSYLVQKRGSDEFEDSRPRDCVLDRIFDYMRTIPGLELLWIDHHSIVQDRDIEDFHGSAARKKGLSDQRDHGLAVMDLVYSLSHHPVGLVGRPIEHDWEMKLLAKLLQGKLTSWEGPRVRLSSKINFKEAWKAIQMLRRITNDDWWKRGWIFQENYKGGTAMVLLIKYSGKLRRLRRRYQKATNRHGALIFGNVKGELCIRSVDFFTQATLLCMAVMKRIIRARRPTRTERDTIKRILKRAGKYSILLQPSQSMTPQSISDLDSKELGEIWDMLPISANCCGYSVRLDRRKLEKEGASLSLSILAQCLLNGEVLHNGRPSDPSTREMTVPEYMKHAIFDEFKSPKSRHSLTFNKSCRFINPSLSISGIHTRGHLWKLADWVIDTSVWPEEGAWVDRLEGKLQGSQRKQLAYLAKLLDEEGYRPLAEEIDTYLEEDAGRARVPDSEMSFVERYKKVMAEEVADAIERGDDLILGCLWNPDDDSSSYMGVFIWYDGGTDEDEGNNGLDGDYAFTASRPEDVSSDDYDLNDLDRHVSFQVEFDDKGGVPNLRIKRWLTGLCFFKGMRREEVVFPWPEGLAQLEP